MGYITISISTQGTVYRLYCLYHGQSYNANYRDYTTLSSLYRYPHSHVRMLSVGTVWPNSMARMAMRLRPKMFENGGGCGLKVGP